MENEKARRRVSESAQQLFIAKATAKLHCDEAAAHLKAEHFEQALYSYNEALKLNPSDKEALVARSRCQILLGNPDAALQDAEIALTMRRNYIPALYQKAEALYHLGNFEYSLMFYHRGLRLRPQLEKFRLGVQKAQEAIVNTIGPTVKLSENIKKPNETSKKPVELSNANSLQKDFKRPISVPASSGNSRQTLGALSIDKVYLEQLINHPQLKFITKENKAVLKDAEEALDYLKVRQRFWEEQLAPSKIKKDVK